MDFVARTSFGHTWSIRLSFEILSTYVHFVGNTDYLDLTLGFTVEAIGKPAAAVCKHAFIDCRIWLMDACMLSFPLFRLFGHCLSCGTIP